MKFIQSYYTDIGVKRTTNQDSLALIKAETDFGDVLLACVCDGMGGHSAGELASKYCVQQIAEWFRTSFPEILYSNFDTYILEDELRDLVNGINHRLAVFGMNHELSLGTTLTAFLFFEDQYFCVHVGDSRGYEITDRVRQITSDDSLVARELEQGIITPEQAAVDRRKNILLQSVGITDQVSMHFYSGYVRENACYLVCCDGFWHCIDDEELVRYLSAAQIRDNRQLRRHLNFLVETDMARGEKDNITAVAVIPCLSEKED